MRRHEDSPPQLLIYTDIAYSLQTYIAVQKGKFWQIHCICKGALCLLPVSGVFSQIMKCTGCSGRKSSTRLVTECNSSALGDLNTYMACIALHLAASCIGQALHDVQSACTSLVLKLCPGLAHRSLQCTRQALHNVQ